MGVIISLTLDDGEEERPHRENIFKQDYQKVGIACGPHKTEFQMCVMDFAFDFQPLNAPNEMKVMMNKEDMMNNSNFANQNNPNNQSPLVKLSLENDDFKSKELLNNPQLVSNVVNPGVVQSNQGANNEIDQLAFETSNLMKTLKVVNKKVEITTTITYTYEDGSTKVVTQNESHDFKS